MKLTLLVALVTALSSHAAVTDAAKKPVYKNPKASIEDRVNDLLSRMTIEDKTAQLIQGDINGWMNTTDSLDNTLAYNATGLVEMMKYKAGSIWGGYSMPYEKFAYAINIGQRYLMENTTLGIPALVQSEGLHGFTNNGTIFPSPPGLAATFDTELIKAVASAISDEAEGLGISHIFAPVLDLGREQRWGRVEEGFGEDPHLTGEIGYAFVQGLQSGKRRNTTSQFRMAATCKHFAAFGSPQGGLNIAPVQGGERELRHAYLKPFKRACVDGDALSLMTSYASYDGIPTIANKHILTDILRKEWGYKYWVTSDAGSVDLLYSTHGVCAVGDRACAAKLTLERGLSGEMGGGTYTYLLLPELVKNGTVSIKYVDETVKYILRAKFALGLFENPYPYPDYAKNIRTAKVQEVLHQVERDAIILLENHDNTLPLKKGGSVALIGPSAGVVSFGDYVFFNASNNGISPLAGFKALLGEGTTVNYAEGAKWWSNDESGFDEAVAAAEKSDVAIVAVGTWSRDQTLLWQGLNATTGEHVDVSDLGLVGAQLNLVKRIKATGKKTIVVYVSGRPVAEPWIAENADAIIQQFYPGELGGLALAEVIFGDVNPSGKLTLSAPRSVGTTPAYYDYLKGARPLDPGRVLDNGTLVFGHQYVLDSPVPLWSFGHGLSYTTWNYSNLRLSKSTLKAKDTLKVTVNVANNGTVAGKEVVQVYLTDVVSSVVTPNQVLAGFAKVDLAPGKSKDVTVSIPIQDLAVWSYDSKWEVEPGEFTLKIGSSQQVYLNSTFTVV